MLDDKVITAKEFHDDHESLEKTLPKVKNLRIELEKRRGKVTKRQYKDYIDYIEIYYKLAVLIRRDKNADITFLAMQYNSKQTAIAIESDSKKIEPMMMTIDEIQPESYNRLVEACNTIARDITELELEEDDRNDLNEYDKQKA